MLMEKLLLSLRQTMGDVIGKYSQRPEFKPLGPDGSLCTKNTVGLLRRRPVIAKAVFQLIGKEVDRGTSEDAYMMEGKKLVRHPNGAPVSFPKALARLSDREIARRTELVLLILLLNLCLTGPKEPPIGQQDRAFERV
jgi:hypothetical protein